MSEHDAAPDPIDTAYAQSEALLTDDDARAARRARVLTAIALEQAPPVPGASSSTRPSHAWRRGGWLAAASIAGFGLFWAADVDQSTHRQTRSAARTTFVPSVATPESGALPTKPAKVVSQAAKPARSLFAAASPPPPPPPASGRAVAGSPALAPFERAPRAFPASPASASAPPPSIDIPVLPLPPVRNPQPESVGPPQPAPPAPPAPAAPPPPPPPAPAPLARLEALARVEPQPNERLRAAARGGQLAEVQALLAEGAPVDAADADGNTALMDSIKANQPAVAAFLREHGASLDQKNRAGLSARDMAKVKDDPELNQALGLDR